MEGSDAWSVRFIFMSPRTLAIATAQAVIRADASCLAKGDSHRASIQVSVIGYTTLPRVKGSAAVSGYKPGHPSIFAPASALGR